MKIIGIVGGAGPYAGIDLQEKILRQTMAEKDQDYLPVISLSNPGRIPDRTTFLAGESLENPGWAIYRQLRQLEAAGAQVATIPCNTAHAPPIDSLVRQELARQNSKLHYLHLIQEVRDFVHLQFPQIKRIGLLATTGTVQSSVYQQFLAPAGISVLCPPAENQAWVQKAIYDPQEGIKTLGTEAKQAREWLEPVATALVGAGAEALILGCTEIPVVVRQARWVNRPVLDPTLILARALIREVDVTRLKPYTL